MSSSLRSEEFAELLQGDLVGIQLEEALSNTDELSKDQNKILELPMVARTEDNMTFQSFIAWLYSIDRSHVLKRHNAIELISLYLFSSALTCESLRTDFVQCLQAILVKDSISANQFLQAFDTTFEMAKEESGSRTNLYTLLDEIRGICEDRSSIDRVDIGHLLNWYVKSVKWGSHNWQNWLMDSIRDGLEETGRVLTFDNVKAVFKATNNLGGKEALRGFCVALAYYQRRHEEGSLKEGQRLDADDMERRFKDIRGFMKAYLLFEDQHRGNFPGEAPKDPRDRSGDMSACYFHIHEEGWFCSIGIDVDDEK